MALILSRALNVLMPLIHKVEVTMSPSNFVTKICSRSTLALLNGQHLCGLTAVHGRSLVNAV